MTTDLEGLMILARRFRLPAVVLLSLPLCAALACGGSPDVESQDTLGYDPSIFAGNPLWDDGRAEISAYQAIMPRDGVPRHFTAYHLIVKEDLSGTDLAKADPGHDPSDPLTVLKMNQVYRYRTGFYSYHQMLSTFHERATMVLRKLSLTSFDWSGNTYKEYTLRDGRGLLHAHTYWDGMAEVTYPVPVGPDVVFYDELPLRVRVLPQTVGTSLALRVVPGQIGSRAPAPEIYGAELRAAAMVTLTVPAGRYEALRWELDAGTDEIDLIWTARAYPHLLLAWERADGASFRLEWSDRLAYWTLNGPGDEQYLERGIISPP